MNYLLLISNDYFFSFSIAAFTKATNNGCGCNTVLLYSGWNWVHKPPLQCRNFTISTKSDSGLIPTHFMPAASYSVFIGRIKLVTVAMTLLYVLCSVGFVCFAAFLQYALIGAQAHGTSHIGNGFLFLHDVDNVVRRLSSISRELASAYPKTLRRIRWRCTACPSKYRMSEYRVYAHI